jgi:hypothetical protein
MPPSPSPQPPASKVHARYARFLLLAIALICPGSARAGAGNIQSATLSGITLKAGTSQSISYTYNDKTEFTVNGKAGSARDLSPGMNAQVTTDPASPRIVTRVSASGKSTAPKSGMDESRTTFRTGERKLQGLRPLRERPDPIGFKSDRLVSVGARQIEISGKEKNDVYPLSPTTQVSINGLPGTIGDLRGGMTVDVETDPQGVVTKISAETTARPNKR